jgi:hypothetical protein
MKQVLGKLMSKEMSVLEAAQRFSVPKHLLWNLLQIIHGREAELKQKLDRLEYNFFLLEKWRHDWSVTFRQLGALETGI